MKKHRKSKRARMRRIPKVKSSARHPAIVQKALRYIDNNLTKIETSSDISDAIGLSREHLSRTFSKATGVKLWEHVNKAKVEKAKEMLKQKAPLIKELYEQLGFGCQSTFYNAFRRYAGTTPHKFRKGLSLKRKKR